MLHILSTSPINIFEWFGGLVDFLKNIKIEIYDLVDIVLLTVVFALFVTFVRRKMLSSAVVGMAIFYIFVGIASVLPLPGISLIASAILKVGALAFILLFHTEIRDLFEKIGSNPKIKLFNSRATNKLNYQIIDNVCSAVRELSATKTGALIVIARTTKLDDVTSTGVTINADVNSYLLRNLFYNKAPLHDGALVIDDGKIVSAGCVLPLTRRKDFEGDLGTRHKAAIGLCEISDAIIIVVSEETGTISVAMDYSFTRDFTSDTLRKFLVTNILQDSDIE
jgi:diadenylate cyclase